MSTSHDPEQHAIQRSHGHGLFAGYSDTYTPLGAYAGLVGIFIGAFAVVTFVAKRHAAAIPDRISEGDIALLGVATHKLTRLITKDWVTSPLRAPFTTYRESTGGGEVREDARGRGMRRALGDLFTCAWCSGPWVAGGLAAGWMFWPKFTRIVSGALVAVTLSDFLHHAYEKAKRWSSS